ncbi:hypothetical protein EST38_g7034 [Candolleomyces aberdarensis]|uniref:F-box domain-containing protein n=1 Tax=Candolleomyces aberdarensis TaxID=2316362 RepID=A0A4Q2DGN0_9AGAR|nr:hypothetical protein EST38_g7034 [Candolleomyces aberdarensis]
MAEPLLWSNLFLHPSQQTLKQESYGTFFLQRAGPSVPLHVSWNLGTFVFDYVTRLIRPSPFFQKLKDQHAEQLTSFQIQGAWHLREQVWDLLEDFHAPNLESLALDLSPWNFSSSSDAPRYLPRIFGGVEGLPMLKRLALKEVLAWPENRFENLTHLSLEQQDRDFRLPISEFLDVLSLSPALEHLRLVNAGPIIPPDPQPPSERTRLPKLRKFEMGEFQLAMDQPPHFLAHLNFPNNCIIHLWSDSLFHSNDATILPHFLAGHLDDPDFGDDGEVFMTTAVVRPAASRNEDTLVFDGDAIYIDTPAPLEYVFSHSRNLLSRATHLFLHLKVGKAEVLASILMNAHVAREITFTVAFNYVSVISWLREARYGEHLERVTFAPMSAATRLKAAERALVKELESQGSIIVDRDPFRPCMVAVATVNAPINPVPRRPLQE